MTTTPWFINVAHGATIIRSQDAPAARREPTHFDTLAVDHAVAEIPDATVAKALVVLHNTTGPLTVNTLAAVRGALDSLGNIAGFSVGDTVTVGRPRIEIRAARVDADGRHSLGVAGFAFSADGDTLRAGITADTVTTLIPAAKSAVAEAEKRLVVRREIGREKVILDAGMAEWFDARNWRAGPYLPEVANTAEAMFADRTRSEIFERDSGARLADLIAGSDGVWIRSHPSWTTPGCGDYRRTSIVTAARAHPLTVEMPLEVRARLQAVAEADHAGDLGKAIGALLDAAQK